LVTNFACQIPDVPDPLPLVDQDIQATVPVQVRSRDLLDYYSSIQFSTTVRRFQIATGSCDCTIDLLLAGWEAAKLV